MDVKSRIASLEAQRNQVPASPLRAPNDGSSPSKRGESLSGLNRSTPKIAPLDAIAIASASASSPSPERPLSTTSFASHNRINRLQRQAAVIVAASSPNNSVGTRPATPITKNKPRAPQPPDSPMDSESANIRQAARERRLMGALSNQKGGELGASPLSLSAHTRGGPAATENSMRSTAPAVDSVNAGGNRNSISNSNGITEVKSPPRTAKLQRVLAKPRTSSRHMTGNSSNGGGKSNSRREMPSETNVPARRQASTAITDSAVGGDQRDGILMPEIEQPSEEEKSPARKSAGRMAKVQQIKKKRSLDQHRRRKKPVSSSSSGQRKQHQQQQQQQQQAHPSSFAEDDTGPQSPTTVQVMPSVDHATDDEMTQTSVRQIVGNAYESPKANECLSPDPDAYGHQSSSRLWMEEKSVKDDPVRGGLMIARSSSTEYDTDGEGHSRIASTLYGEDVAHDPSLSVVSSSQVTPAEAALLGKNRQKKLKKWKQAQGNNNGTFDYGERDDEGSAASLSYEQRRQREVREKDARNVAVAAAKAKMDDGPFVQTEDVEHYRKSLNTPIVKTAFGVVGAATVGCILLGPVGLLVGAAAVGIGIGAMQIPEEQRSHMQDKASETMKSVQDSALNASETLSNSCAASYKDSGIAEHVPADMENCFAVVEDEVGVAENELVDELKANDKAHPLDPSGQKAMDGRPVPSPSRTGRLRDQKEKVACLQQGQIFPVSQIHSLQPSAQPRAWLDVVASADTTNEEKSEAMEEILILAKDKQRARIFLEEGILDSIMWIIERHREKLGRNAAWDDWAHPNITPEETKATKLAASCCLTLGKSHCAAIHTEGDLLLMSLYERGTVPEERQLAQMLHEIPFHTRATVTDDPTIIDPRREVFAVKHASLPQAEELARSITALAAGRL